MNACEKGYIRRKCDREMPFFIFLQFNYLQTMREKEKREIEKLAISVKAVAQH